MWDLVSEQLPIHILWNLNFYKIINFYSPLLLVVLFRILFLNLFYSCDLWLAFFCKIDFYFSEPHCNVFVCVFFLNMFVYIYYCPLVGRITDLGIKDQLPSQNNPGTIQRTSYLQSLVETQKSIRMC